MRSRTEVVIVGGGPAGLMLSHLLHVADIDSVVLDNRTVETIEHTHRAGILEQDTVRLLVESGVSDRVLTDGHEHQGISLRFGGQSHRIDFQGLAGASCWLYPQTDVFVDLHRARVRDGGDLRYGVAETRVVDPADSLVEYVDAEGGTHEVAADLVVGADGSHSRCREVAAGDPTTQVYARSYPFAWFGVLVQAPPSAPELVYTRSPLGFALLSQRTAEIQRMYFQCDPDEDADQWSDDRIWAELQSRLAGEDGFRLVEGPVVERTVLGFRSFVQAPMRNGRLLLAGDAGHTVPPTGAKGLNLALADVRVLAEEIERALAGREEALDAYSTRALERVWRAQHFSYWMTSMLHQVPGATDFDERRQLAELASVVASTAGSTYLAEGYTGWPRS
ncbi:MAG TPA: 4-hydroxybenzoate 3-monooxygenase [Lapillicoccus sp.]|nr:4-hydroxybenzoate 3-monooxygenase [Lapillicoccus sp.]